MTKLVVLVILLLMSWIAVMVHSQSTYQISGTYTNAAYGFSIGYDTLQHHVEPGWDESHFWLRRLDHSIVAFAEVIPLGKENLQTEALCEAQLSCAADGPDGSSWCEKADTVREHISKQGLRVLKFYQLHVSLTAGTEIHRTIGPYYAIDISNGESKYGLLISHSIDPTHDVEHALRTMVETIRVIHTKK